MLKMRTRTHKLQPLLLAAWYCLRVYGYLFLHQIRCRNSSTR